MVYPSQPPSTIYHWLGTYHNEMNGKSTTLADESISRAISFNASQCSKHRANTRHSTREFIPTNNQVSRHSQVYIDSHHTRLHHA